jgi:hypothetical protein
VSAALEKCKTNSDHRPVSPQNEFHEQLARGRRVDGFDCRPHPGHRSSCIMHLLKKGFPLSPMVAPDRARTVWSDFDNAGNTSSLPALVECWDTSASPDQRAAGI